MPVYNKLKIAILAFITTPTAYALTLDPIEIQSGAGNLLYAEMKFRNAEPNSRIEAGLAESQDLIRLGIGHQPPGHLNFFTRKSGDGSGVIVITSSRPMLESELNILIKIKEGNATHIQQIKTPLKRSAITPQKVHASNRESALMPQTVVSEKDIALNLPMSSQYSTTTNAASQSMQSNSATVQSSAHSLGIPLAINISPIPAMNSSKMARVTPTQMPQTTASASTQSFIQSYDQPSTAIVNALPSTLTISETIRPSSIQKAQATTTATDKAQATTPKASAQAASTKAKIETIKPSEKSTESVLKPQIKAQSTHAGSANTSHVVQANESLWAIASQVAIQNNRSIPEVMQQIKADNEHAFIGGNINRIRRGAALNIAAMNDQKSAKTVKARPVNPNASQPQSGKEKYKLNQAEMKLVTESKQDSAQGAAKEQSIKNQTSKELASKVMTVREKTVKLQNSVSQLTLAIQQKDHRIQLLNARLAQLQQQLQQKNQAVKPVN